jgi:hypothetical protein
VFRRVMGISLEYTWSNGGVRQESSSSYFCFLLINRFLTSLEITKAKNRTKESNAKAGGVAASTLRSSHRVRAGGNRLRTTRGFALNVGPKSPPRPRRSTERSKLISSGEGTFGRARVREGRGEGGGSVAPEPRQSSICEPKTDPPPPLPPPPPSTPRHSSTFPPDDARCVAPSSFSRPA